MSETCEGYNVKDEYKSWLYENVKSEYRNNSYPFGVGIFNVRGSLNAGIIIRTACGFNAKDFFVFGDHRYDRRSCVGSHNYIPVHSNIDPQTPNELTQYLSSKGYYPVLIEQGSVDIKHFNPEKLNGLMPCLIFGSESHGIPEEFCYTCLTYSIEMKSVIRSLNVSSAAAIAIHAISSKFS